MSMEKNIFSIGTDRGPACPAWPAGRRQAGFTLVEMMVAIFIVSLIFLIVGSVFVSALNLQRRANNFQRVEEDATFVLESMAKEIRVSQIIPEIPDSACPANPETELNIVHPDHGPIRYVRLGNDVYRQVGGVGTVMNSAANVRFTKLGFCVSGAKTGDGKQPRITIFATVESVKTQQQVTINTQITLSPRTLNN